MKILVKIHFIYFNFSSSHQLLTYLPEKTISNCQNLREVDLSANSLTMLQDNTFLNLTLNKLNLSNNKLR